MDRYNFLQYIIANNPEGVAERLGELGITYGEQYGGEDLYGLILQQADYEMELANGDPDAYWNTVAEVADVPIVDGPYAAEILRTLENNGNTIAPDGGGITIIKQGFTRADVIDWLLIVGLGLLIVDLVIRIFKR